jgi:hypothetical protein
MYFNELCREFGIKERYDVAKALIRLQRANLVEGKMIQSSFETSRRWVRQYSVVRR